MPAPASANRSLGTLFSCQSASKLAKQHAIIYLLVQPLRRSFLNAFLYEDIYLREAALRWTPVCFFATSKLKCLAASAGARSRFSPSITWMLSNFVQIFYGER